MDSDAALAASPEALVPLPKTRRSKRTSEAGNPPRNSSYSDPQKQLVKAVQDLARIRYQPWQVWSDFVEMAAIQPKAIRNNKMNNMEKLSIVAARR